MAAVEPIGAMRWSLEIKGIQVAVFKEVSGLDSEIDVVEYRATGDKGNLIVVKIPGTLKWPNIVMKRGMTDDLALWAWHQQFIDGKVDGNRHSGTITCFAPNNVAVTKFNFTDGWPCKYKGPSLDAGKNEIAIEELEIAHMGLVRVKA